MCVLRLAVFLVGICGVFGQLMPQCPICENGTAIPPEFADVIISAEQYGAASCASLGLPLTQGLFEDCYVTQVLAGYYCGCNVPEPAEGDERCLACADGSALSLEFASNQIEKRYTCGDAGIDSLYASSDDEDCPWYQAMGFIFCGCPIPPPPSEDRCSLCADGSTVPMDFSPNRLDQGFTCVDLLSVSLYEPADGEDCPFYQAAAHLFCGCPTPPPPSEDRCSLCADGSALNLDFSGSLIEKGFTCADAFLDSINLSSDSEFCPWFQAMGYAYCGCPTPPPPSEERCSLCTGDAAAEWPEPDQLTLKVDRFYSCRAVLDEILHLDANDPDCGGYQALAATYCACPSLDGPKCSLCGANGELGNPTAVLEMGFTCRAAEVYTTGFDPDSDFCTVLQATYGVYCGCTDEEGMPSYDVATQDVEANICRVCGSPGSTVTAVDPFEQFAVINEEGVIGDDDASFYSSCAELESWVAFRAAEFPNAGCDVPSEVSEICCGSATDCPPDAPKGTRVTFLQKIKGGKVGCAEIAASPDKDLYCQSFQKIKRACRQTCDACRKDDDVCVDNGSKTFKAYKFLEKHCPWLAKRSESRKKKFCKVSSEARETCPQSCDTCR